jgi:hypothetical protein
MLEVDAITLSDGDEFTKDDGETWITAKVIRVSDAGKRVIVIDTNNKEHQLRFTQKVIVKV